MQTKRALGCVYSRYRSVLRKCHANNMLAKMLITGTIVLAAPLPAEADDSTQSVTDTQVPSVLGPCLYPDTGDAIADGVNITVSNSKVDTFVTGIDLYSHTGAASSQNSIVNVTSGTSVGTYVYGQRAQANPGAASALNSAVTVSGSSVGTDVHGQDVRSISGDASAKISAVTLTSGGTIGGHVYGQYVKASGAAMAQDSTVTVSSGSSVSAFIYGQYAESSAKDASAEVGTVTVSGASSVRSQIYGQKVQSVSGAATAQNSTVNIFSGSTVTSGIYGQHVKTTSGTASAQQSKITVSDSTVSSSVNGQAVWTTSGKASAQEAEVTVSNSTIKGTLFGAAAYIFGKNASEGASASQNRITISGEKTEIAKYMYGGYAYNLGSGIAEASSNRIEATGPGVSMDSTVYAGCAQNLGSGSAKAEGNELKLTDAEVKKTAASGYAYVAAGKGNAQALTNRAELTDAAAGSSVYAGMAWNKGSGTAVSAANTLTLTRGNDGSNVTGGYAVAAGNTARAGGNTVSATGSTIGGTIWGGYAQGAGSGAVEASGNKVTLTDAAAGTGIYAGHAINKGSGEAAAEGNTVTLNGGSYKSDVYGGAASSAGGTAKATGNTVTVNGSQADGSVFGGWSSGGSASGNTVTVKGGTVNGGIEAGHARSGDASGNTILVEGGSVLEKMYGGYTGDGSASRNVITVTGGTVNAEIVGGYDDGTATDNTVTLYDAASFAGSNIYGGRSGNTSSGVFTGNTLNVHGQIQAASMQNFQNLNFNNVAEDTASVDLSKSAVIGDGKGSMTNVHIANLKEQSGDIPEEYVLVHTPKASSSFNGTNLYVNGGTVVTVGSDGSYVPYAGTVANDGTMDNATGSTGMTKSQTLSKGFLSFDVDYFIKNGQDLIARWNKQSTRADEKTKSFTGDRLASAALMDEGADFVAGEGIANAMQASQCLPGEPCGAKAFMAMNGGYSTYKAGTTIHMSYGNLLAGLAHQCKVGPMGYLAGVFFETGLGRFHTEYEPDGGKSYDSEGHNSYYGVGALAKVFLNRDLLKGLYAEGSIRYGVMTDDWQSNDISVNGRNADWDSRSPYLTLHGGLGYMWNVTDKVTADVYAKYFWGHLWSADGSISGEKFEFDDIYSSRVRTGARLNFQKDETFSWYLGGAWEHQFEAKSKASIYGFDVPSNDLKGNTAIAEAGIYVKPEALPDFSFMLGATGYFGEKREGVTGHLQVRYEF